MPVTDMDSLCSVHSQYGFSSSSAASSCNIGGTKDCWCCSFLYLPAAQCLCNSFQRNAMRSLLPVAMPRDYLWSLLPFYNCLQTELGIKLKASDHMEWKALQAPKVAER